MFALHNLIDFLSEYSICEISKAFKKELNQKKQAEAKPRSCQMLETSIFQYFLN